MQKRWPLGVLLIALIGLGYISQQYLAEPIQTKIQAASTAAIGEGTRHGADVRVSGRDITVSGVLHDIAERDALAGTLDAVPGRRVVNMDQVTLLRVADPYTAQIVKSDTGLKITTDIPDEKMGTALTTAFGENASVAYELGSGIPDDAWTGQLVGSAIVLDQFEYGAIDITDKALVLTGRTKERSAKEFLETHAAKLPAGYTLDISAVEYPLPFNFLLSKTADSGVQLVGVAPETFDAQVAASRISADKIDATQLELVADGDPAIVNDALGKLAPVLADLKSYEVKFAQLETPQFSLEGVASPNIDLDAFEAKRVAAGVEADQIEMPRPFDVQFSLDAVKGAQLVGLAPEGFDPQEIATNLGLPKINTDNFEVGARGDSTALSDQISNLKPVLEDLETLEVGLETAKEAPDIVAETLPNADPARVSSFLKEIFVSLKEVNVTPTKNVYVDGQERVNGITGVREQYQAGYWIPLVTVTDASAAACKAITDNILADRKIVFESGRASLDASARVVINRLTGVISSCLAQAALNLELAGHTDKSGDTGVNLRISVARVNTVKDALVTRGIDQDKIKTVGYGETRPIADNATKEGRSANRRTELDWLAATAAEQ